MHPMLNIAVRAARRAGTILARGQNRLYEVHVEQRGEVEFSTDIGRKADIAILDTLQTAYPGHASASRESGQRGDSEFLWLVEPLSGVTNYLRGNPHFAVSIALEVRGRLNQAVVYDPLRDEMFTASRGSGALLNDHKIRSQGNHRTGANLIGVGASSRRGPDSSASTPSFSGVTKAPCEMRSSGSAALDMAYVACGRLDGYWEFNLHAFEVAAGCLLVSESGGLVGDPYGGETHLESGRLVAATPRMFRELLPALSKISKATAPADLQSNSGTKSA